MAKEEEKDLSGNKKGPQGNTRSSSPAKENSLKGEKSGKVKGPMGIGGKTKPDSTAKVKKPSKGAQPIHGRMEDPETGNNPSKEEKSNGEQGEPKNLPRPRKKLPEKTSDAEEELVVTDSDAKSRLAEEEKQTDSLKRPLPPETGAQKEGLLPSEDADYDASTKKMTPEGKGKPGQDSQAAEKNRNPKTSQKEKESRENRTDAPTEDSGETKEKKAPAKKMPRRKPVKGISAEEKMKLSNTSATEDVKNKITDTAKDLVGSVFPSKETKEQLGEVLKRMIPDEQQVKQMIPDEEEIKATASKISSFLTPGNENLEDILEKIPDEDLRNQLRRAIMKVQQDQGASSSDASNENL